MHSLRESQSFSNYMTEMAQRLRPLSPAQRAEELREVQAHLESAVAAMQEGGLSEAEAVERVLAQFGQAKTVARRFVSVWRRGETKKRRAMMKERIIFGASLATVSLATIWLMFSLSIISQLLFPQGKFLILASEGASLQVHQGIVQVLSAGSGGAGVERFNGPALLLVIAVPLALIVGFAVVGCCSMLRPRRAVR